MVEAAAAMVTGSAVAVKEGLPKGAIPMSNKRH